jgi:hypothetical protein
MTRRTLTIVVVAAALLVFAAVALRGQGGGAFADWFQRLHGH